MNPSANQKDDLDRGLDAIQALFHAQQLCPEVGARDEEGLVLLFDLVGDRYAVHLRVTRWPREQTGTGSIPPMLLETSRLHAASPLQLRVNLVPGEEGIGYDYHGVAEFIRAIRTPSRRWKLHLLAGIDAREWGNRSGGYSSLRATVENGALKLLIDGKTPVVPLGEGRFLEDPPLDPVELCRSTVVDDECWIFTCGCGIPGCNGIYSGILVVHQDGLTVWRSLENPTVPLAVFHKGRYQRTILAATKALLRELPRGKGDYWVRTERKDLAAALNKARTRQKWFNNAPMVISSLE